MWRYDVPQQPWHQFYENRPNSWQPSHADALTAFRAAAQSGRGGISYFGRRLTFAQIDAASERLAGWAAAQGVTRGARVAIVLQNVPAFVIAAVATWKLGAIPVPGNPGYRAAELSRVFADCRPSLVLCHPEHCTQIEPALAAASLVAPILVVSGRDQADSPDPRIVPMADPVAGAYLRLDDVLALLDAGALTAHCRNVLAPYKCPRDVRFLAELPKTVSGKIQRRALRQPKASPL